MKQNDVGGVAAEPYSLVVGHWKDEVYSIHGPNGHIASGIQPAAAKALVDELNLLASPVAAPVVGWQPIETAPKDGTTVLAWRKHAGIPFFIRYDRQYEWFEDDSRNQVYDLTHWQPLPAPPAIASQEVGNVSPE